MIKKRGAWLCALASFGLMATAYTAGPFHRPSPAPYGGCGVVGEIDGSRAGSLPLTVLVDYPLDDVRAGAEAPRAFVAALPEVASDEPSEARKDVFLRGMLPMVLAVNETLMTQRYTLMRLYACEEEGQTLTPSARAWLAALGAQYGTDPEPRALLDRVDIVPPSLALAQSAIESGWGQSRFARERNAFFGERRLVADATTKADGAREPAVLRLAAFGRPIDAVTSYVDNLNTHPAYAEFRQLRAAQRSLHMPLDPVRLAGTLHRYSERRAAYIRDVRQMIVANSLTDFDSVRLEKHDAPRQVAER